MHASSLDPFAGGRDEVQGIDRARVAKGDAVPMQIGEARGKRVMHKRECVQDWYPKENVLVKVRWKQDDTCSCCQRNGHVECFCRVCARDLRKKASTKEHLCEGGDREKQRSCARRCLPYVQFAVTSACLLQHADERGWLLSCSFKFSTKGSRSRKTASRRGSP